MHNVFLCCSNNKQMLLCGMHSGSIRVYPLPPGDHRLKSMHAYWALSVHDNQYGHLQHIRSSYNDQFVLTAGDDGNIFSFSLLPSEELQRGLAKIPLPRVRAHTPIINSTFTTCADGPWASLYQPDNTTGTILQHRHTTKKRNYTYFHSYLDSHRNQLIKIACSRKQHLKG